MVHNLSAIFWRNREDVNSNDGLGLLNTICGTVAIQANREATFIDCWSLQWRCKKGVLRQTCCVSLHIISYEAGSWLKNAGLSVFVLSLNQ